MNRVCERLGALREAMKREKVDVYYINTADFHNSEYVSDYFKVREFFSGFTGSAGDLIVSAKEAGLWTDGRYFGQAERELAGSGIKLFKLGEPGVVRPEAYLKSTLKASEVLGFDGRCVSAAFGMLLSGALIYEATIVLYSPIQLHRMLLAVTVACGILIIDLSDGRTLPFIQELAILGLMTFLVINRPSSYVVPQMDPTSITGTAQETEQAELAALLPLSEDPWDNTIAKEAEGENLEYAFLAPSWTAFNICQYDVLEEKLRTGTLQSRYVLLAEDSDLKKLCDSLCREEKLSSAKDAGGKTGLGKAGTVENASKAVKLEQIWEKYGHVLYKVK